MIHLKSSLFLQTNPSFVATVRDACACVRLRLASVSTLLHEPTLQLSVIIYVRHQGLTTFYPLGFRRQPHPACALGRAATSTRTNPIY
jgi:hypothetical protein